MEVPNWNINLYSSEIPFDAVVYNFISYVSFITITYLFETLILLKYDFCTLYVVTKTKSKEGKK